VAQGHQPGCSWEDFPHVLYFLDRSLRQLHRHAGDVSAWMSKASDKAIGYGISYIDDNDRNPGGPLLDCARRRRSYCNDEIDVLRNEIVGERSITAARCPPVDHCEVRTLDVTKLLQGLAKYLVEWTF